MAACALSIPAAALTKASYRRLDVDEPEDSSSPISFLRVDDSQVSIFNNLIFMTTVSNVLDHYRTYKPTRV